MKKQVMIKYNEDDILEILSEYVAEEKGFDTFSAKAVILGTPGEDLRLVAVIGDLDDESMKDIDLEDIDSKIEFNGSHSKNMSYIDLEKFVKMDINDC